MATYPDHTSRATGSVSHTLPPAVEAGSYQEFVLTYTAGYFGVDDTGSIKICWRYAADIGTPQFDDPAAPHYVSARASNGAALAVRYDPKDNVRPWGRTVQVKVLNGFLREGDRIEVRFGDRSHGGPGIRMQTFCESTFELKVLVDPIATYSFEPVEGVRTIAIVPGPPVRWCALLPTAGVPGAPFRLLAKAEDRWGNPTAAEPTRFHLRPSLSVHGLPDTLEIGGGERAVRVEGLSMDAPGGLTIAFEPERSGSGAPFRTNAMVVSPTPRWRRYWGDLHSQSEETIGSGSAEEYFSFARDLAGLDFAGHQGNDFQITGRFWEHLQRLTRAVDEPGRFVVFPGYEWSGNTALGGDRNVLFLSEGQQIHRSSHALVDDPDRDTDRTHVTDLFAALRGRPALLIPHVGGRYSDVRFHDPMQRSVEVHSAWGTFEWLLGDALARGQRVGIVCNSDGHKGRPGASYPGASEFGSYGGLTCMLAPELTRAALWDALVRRHHYGTTGARIHLEVQAAVDGVRLDDDPRTGAGGALRRAQRGHGRRHCDRGRGAGTGDLGAWNGAAAPSRSAKRYAHPADPAHLRPGRSGPARARALGGSCGSRSRPAGGVGRDAHGGRQPHRAHRGLQLFQPGPAAGARCGRLGDVAIDHHRRRGRHRLLVGGRRRPGAGRHGAVDLRAEPGRVGAPGTDRNCRWAGHGAGLLPAPRRAEDMLTRGHRPRPATVRSR